MDVTIEGATGSLTVSNTLVSLGELDLQSPNFQFDDVDGAGDGVHRSRSPGTQSEVICSQSVPFDEIQRPGIKACMWLEEISSCSCLTVLPSPAWLLLKHQFPSGFLPHGGAGGKRDAERSREES